MDGGATRRISISISTTQIDPEERERAKYSISRIDRSTFDKNHGQILTDFLCTKEPPPPPPPFCLNFLSLWAFNRSKHNLCIKSQKDFQISVSNWIVTTNRRTPFPVFSLSICDISLIALDSWLHKTKQPPSCCHSARPSIQWTSIINEFLRLIEFHSNECQLWLWVGTFASTKPEPSILHSYCNWLLPSGHPPNQPPTHSIACSGDL